MPRFITGGRRGRRPQRAASVARDGELPRVDEGAPELSLEVPSSGSETVRKLRAVLAGMKADLNGPILKKKS